MKDFFEKYSYDSMRMFLSQMAISLFGFSLALASVKAKNDTLLWISSLGAIVFYLCLVYGTAWRVGSKDCNSIRLGKRPFRPFTGFFISLLANSINLILALLMLIAVFAKAGSMETVTRFIALFIQGMYQGILVVLKIGETSLNAFPWVYFLIPLPAILISTLGYIAGAKDFMITRLGVPDLPASDRPTKQELKEQRKEKRDRK